MMKLNVRAFANSWKTTTVAVLLAIDSVIHAGMNLLDSDPATNPDWNVVIALWIAAFGMLFSRDADKSSQDAGVRS